MKQTLFPVVFWLLVILGVIGVVKKVSAEPIAQAEQGGVRIVLYTDPCTLKGIANPPRRATFHEGTKTYEGCVGLSPELSLFLFYFEDQTVVAVPQPFFVRVHGS